MEAFSHGLSRGSPALTDWGFDRPDSGFSVPAAHRAGLGRGLVFVLLLTSSLLGSIYVPLALHGCDWMEDAALTSVTAVR